jgi:hypothetical protein
VSARAHPCIPLRMSELPDRIFMELGMKAFPLEANTHLCLLPSVKSTTPMVYRQKLWAGHETSISATGVPYETRALASAGPQGTGALASAVPYETRALASAGPQGTGALSSAVPYETGPLDSAGPQGTGALSSAVPYETGPLSSAVPYETGPLASAVTYETTCPTNFRSSDKRCNQHWTRNIRGLLISHVVIHRVSSPYKTFFPNEIS